MPISPHGDYLQDLIERRRVVLMQAGIPEFEANQIAFEQALLNLSVLAWRGFQDFQQQRAA